MRLPAHLLGPEEQPRLDREAEDASQRAYGVGAAIMPVLLVALTWGGLMLVGAWLAAMLDGTIPSLTVEQADTYAEAIITANDAGRFEEAWEVLGEALEWQDDPPHRSEQEASGN